jgi:predicted DNA-binding transcriptional regulator AlpA
MEQSVSPENQILLTVRETARRLGIARRTLEREVARGNFPSPVKIGAKSLYFIEDIQSYLAKLKEQRNRLAVIAKPARL